MPEEKQEVSDKSQETKNEEIKKEEVVDKNIEISDEEEAVFKKDTNGLSKEELEVFKKDMHRAFTKKAQKASEYQKKADALDRLLENPKFVDWAKKQMQKEDGIDEEKLEDKIDREIEDEEKEPMSEEEKRLSILEQKQMRMEAKQELDALVQQEKYKDMPKYFDKMLPFVKKGYSYEDAFIIAKYPELESKVIEGEKTKKEKEISDKQKQNVSSKDSYGSNKEDILVDANGKKLSFREAYLLTKSKKQT